MRKLRICLVSQQLGEVKSGVGVYARNLATGLLADGHSVTLICPRERATTPIPSLRLELVSERRTGSSHVRWLMLSKRFGGALRALIPHQKFDLVHFTDARDALFCPRGDFPTLGMVNDYYFAAAPRSPWAFREDYVDWPIRWAYYNTVRLLEQRALRKLTTVVCNSQHTKQVLAQQYNLPLERLQVVYMSIDLDRYVFRPRRPENGEPRVLFIGGNVQRKGLPALIRAAPLVLKVVPRTTFVVVGDNQNLGAMMALCSQHGVDGSFHFPGWRSHDQIQEDYQKATVFVMPSLMEAFGIVFLEAMASGVPVIGGDVGGIRELIQDGVNGLLVPPRDHRALAQKILYLFQNEHQRQQLIRNGLETVQRYGTEGMLQKTYALYERLVG
jgi:glycosyltransferase involved in cell wall biosynthesis